MVVRTQPIRFAVLAATLVALTLGAVPSRSRGAEAAILPNGWRVTPAGAAVLDLGTLPLHLTQDPSGRWLAISNAGFGDLAITIVSEQTGRVVAMQPIARTFYGLAFSPADDALYASTAADGSIVHYAFDAATGKLTQNGVLTVGAGKLWVNGIVVSPDSNTVYAAVAGANDLVGINASTAVTQLDVHVGDTPYAVVLAHDGSKAYVSNWGGASVSVVDPTRGAVIATIQTDAHPGAMLLGDDNRTLYVACANDNFVDVIDTYTNRLRGKFDVSLYPQSLPGSTPDGLALSQDGRTLFVADADNNAVVAVDVTSTAPAVIGALPVGWYPTDVAISKDGRRLYVLDGKGLSGHANPAFVHDDVVPASQAGIGEKFYAPNTAIGDLETFTSIDRNTLANGLTSARADSPYHPNYAASTPQLPPFKHIIYVIKENRTYDEILGDDPRGNGQASLAIFGQRFTPNIHRLADEFVLLDNFESEGTVSADGHQWTDGAYATDYVQRLWPSSYAGRDAGFFDFGGAINRPPSGYIWDVAGRQNVSVRLYGEGAVNASSPAVGLDPSITPLLDPNYRPFDVTYSDQARVVEWLREFRQFEQNGALPQLEVVWLPSDHTAALKPLARTPYSMIADNDYALGRMIEALSHSRYWKDTLLVSIEDDAQAGPDHVSNQRMEALVVSPYVNRGLVDHTHYTTSSVLRTIEIALGLPAMSQFDAGATPLNAIFVSVPDLRPWKASLPGISLESRNPAAGPGAKASEKLDFTAADAVDPQEFHRILATYLKNVKI